MNLTAGGEKTRTKRNWLHNLAFIRGKSQPINQQRWKSHYAMLGEQRLHAGSAPEEPEPGLRCSSHSRLPWLAHRERLIAAESKALPEHCEALQQYAAGQALPALSSSRTRGSVCSLTSTAQSASPHKKLSNTCLGHRQTSWRQGNSFESTEAVKASQNTSERQEEVLQLLMGAVKRPLLLLPRFRWGAVRAAWAPATPAGLVKKGPTAEVKWSVCMPASGARVFSFVFKEKKRKKPVSKSNFWGENGNEWFEWKREKKQKKSPTWAFPPH